MLRVSEQGRKGDGASLRRCAARSGGKDLGIGVGQGPADLQEAVGAEHRSVTGFVRKTELPGMGRRFLEAHWP